MSILRRSSRNPAAGYATDFVEFVRRALPSLVEGACRWSPTPAA